MESKILAVSKENNESDGHFDEKESSKVEILPRKVPSVAKLSDDGEFEHVNKEQDDSESCEKGTRKYRLALLSFWLFGVCNSFAYVVMLSAAHDILEDGHDEHENMTLNGNRSIQNFSDPGEIQESDVLNCNKVGTGAILLADVVPTLFVTLTFPFFLQQIPYHIKLGLIIGFCAASFIIVALANKVWLSVIGVVCASISAGLGEITFLSLSTFYHKDVISSWSSGTGGAGLLGSLVYAGFTSMGLTPRTTLLIMLVVPMILMISYMCVLPSAAWDVKRKEKSKYTTNTVEKLSYKRKFQLIPSLAKYMVPMTLVYFAEYFINQGLHEFLYFNGEIISPDAQYRWYQVDYQIGVFISRSSVNLIKIRKLWVLPILQLVNMVLLLFQLYYRFIPNFWIIIVIVLWEGLLGGAAYVNTFYQMTNELSSDIKEYCIGVATFGDSIGIAGAGVAAIPFHNRICSLKLKI